MAATALTKAQVTTLGVNPNFQAVDAANGNSVLNATGRTYLLVRNLDAGARTVTIPKQVATRPAEGTFPSTAVADIVSAIPAGESRIIGPFPAAYQDGNGNIQITWSAGTDADTTIAPFDVP